MRRNAIVRMTGWSLCDNIRQRCAQGQPLVLPPEWSIVSTTTTDWKPFDGLHETTRRDPTGSTKSDQSSQLRLPKMEKEGSG
mmetsp:Transcript_31872/g.77256  ORF Transcript_31872/g.77256 Transcript_31872/m.77256 type:complete len:82 (-) Transcript_31872:1111-1356(-)